jgi:uncharacterized protein (TIGR02246 family)
VDREAHVTARECYSPEYLEARGRSAGNTAVNKRPTIGIVNADAEAAVAAFAAGLQAGYDRRDAEILNHQFAADVIWGSPYGALVRGYDKLHPIHVHFQQQPRTGPAFRYAIQNILPLSADVIVAHIARLALSSSGEPVPPTSDPHKAFSEMALYVLVRHQGEWWLAAGQNTPMRPGGAVSARAS